MQGCPRTMAYARIGRPIKQLLVLDSPGYGHASYGCLPKSHECALGGSVLRTDAVVGGCYSRNNQIEVSFAHSTVGSWLFQLVQQFLTRRCVTF